MAGLTGNPACEAVRRSKVWMQLGLRQTQQQASSRACRLSLRQPASAHPRILSREQQARARSGDDTPPRTYPTSGRSCQQPHPQAAGQEAKKLTGCFKRYRVWDLVGHGVLNTGGATKSRYN